MNQLSCCKLTQYTVGQHVHLTNISVWFGLLGDIKDRRT